MVDPDPLVSIVVSSVPHAAAMRATLDSILHQEYSRVQIFVLDQTADAGLAHEYGGRVEAWERITPAVEVDALNHAFAQSQGQVMWWLAGAEILCPWAFRLTTFVLENLPQVQWLTSGTPLVWSPNQMCVPGGLADGYAKRAFFAGRNLKTSAYFHFPIWRSGTLWCRSLWKASGAHIAYGLQDAGDYELWTRFWQQAELVTLHVPVAGTQTGTRSLETELYWRKASAYLDAYGRPPTPLPLWLRAQQQLVRRIPALLNKWTQPAPLVWISPATLECGMSTRGIL